jgi:hypothetical protein
MALDLGEVGEHDLEVAAELPQNLADTRRTVA